MARAEARLSLDLRSLALFRIAVASIVLCDLADRARNLRAHYTDAGVLPRAVWEKSAQTPYSFHALSGSVEWVSLLFIAAALAGLALLFGWRTRTATAVSWVLLVSLNHRNPYLVFGADLLLGALLFWGMFLPWGERFSLDAARAGKKGPGRAVSAATDALFAQVMLVYAFGVIHKIRGTDWLSGQAVLYALRLDSFATPFGKALLPHRELLTVLTYAVLAIELAIPALLVISYRRAAARVAAVALGALLQLGIGSSMHLWIFPWTTTAMMLAFLPEEAWGREKPEGAPRGLPAWASWTATAALFLAIYSSVTAPKKLSWGMPSPVRSALTIPWLCQNWTMFAPNIPHKDAYLVAAATLDDGREIDLMRGGTPMDWTKKPEKNTAALLGQRWQEYSVKCRRGKQPEVLRALGDYLAREWKRKGGAGKIGTIRMAMLVDHTAPERKPDLHKRLITKYRYEENPAAV